MVLAIQRLQEVQTLLTTRDPDATRYEVGGEKMIKMIHFYFLKSSYQHDKFEFDLIVE